MDKFDLKQNVPMHLAFLFLLILSFAVALYVVRVAGNIVDNAKKSAGFNIQENGTADYKK